MGRRRRRCRFYWLPFCVWQACLSLMRWIRKHLRRLRQEQPADTYAEPAGSILTAWRHPIQGPAGHICIPRQRIFAVPAEVLFPASQGIIGPWSRILQRGWTIIPARPAALSAVSRIQRLPARTSHQRAAITVLFAGIYPAENIAGSVQGIPGLPGLPNGTARVATRKFRLLDPRAASANRKTTTKSLLHVKTADRARRLLIIL